MKMPRTSPQTGATQGFLERPYWLIGALFLAQACLLSLLRTGTSFDGAEQLLYTQYFDFGYGRSQPPVYTWLLILMQKVFGVTQLAENLLKFGLLFAGLELLRRIALKFGYARATAGAVFLSPFLMFEVSWEMQRAYSNSAALFALLPAVALVYLNLVQNRHAGRYALFGLVSGFFVLTKYNAVVLLLALIAADFFTLRREAVMNSRLAAVAIAAFLLVTAPHLWWVSSNLDHTFVRASRFEMTGGVWGAADMLRGLISFSAAAAEIFALPVILTAIAFWQLRSKGVTPANWFGELPRGQRLMLYWSGIFIVMSLTGVILSRATEVVPRWIFPSAIPLLPVLVGSFCQVNPGMQRHFVRLCMVLIALAMPGQWLHSAFANPKHTYDYAKLAAAFPPTDAVLMQDYSVFANLRLYRPELVYLSTIMPKVDPTGIDRALAVYSKVNDKEDLAKFAISLGFCQIGAVSDVEIGSSLTSKKLTVHIVQLSPCKS